jgi:hypothetical protein
VAVLMQKSESDIRTAIQECLDECYGADSPVVKLAESIEKLRIEGWEPPAIHRVELSVLKLLAALLRPKDEPGCE